MLVGDQYIGRLYITVDDPKVMQMCKPYRRFEGDLFLKWKLVDCLINVNILLKSVQTADNF